MLKSCRSLVLRLLCRNFNQCTYKRFRNCLLRLFCRLLTCNKANFLGWCTAIVDISCLWDLGVDLLGGRLMSHSFCPLTGLWKKTESMSAIWRVVLAGTVTERVYPRYTLLSSVWLKQTYTSVPYLHTVFTTTYHRSARYFPTVTHLMCIPTSSNSSHQYIILWQAWLRCHDCP